MKKFQAYKPNVCEHCRQTTDYEMKLDKGSAQIVIAIGNAVRRKNKNRVHLLEESVQSPKDAGYDSWREMIADGKMTFRMVCNASRPVRFGLIAMVENGSGEYLLTPRGAQFLRGKPIPRRAIIEKRTHSKLYYRFEEEDTITIKELLKKDEAFWSGEQEKFERANLMQEIEQQTLFV